MGERLRPAAGGVPPSTSPVVSPLPRGLQPQCPPRPLPPLPARCPPVRLLAPGPCLELRLGGGRIKPRLCQVPKTTEAPNVPLSSAPSLATPQLVPPLRSPPCGRGGRGSRPPSAAGRRPHQALFMGSEEQKLASIDFISITSENQSFPKTAFKRLSGGEYRVYLGENTLLNTHPKQFLRKAQSESIFLRFTPVPAFTKICNLICERFAYEGGRLGGWRIRTTHPRPILPCTIPQMSAPTHRRGGAAHTQ